MQYQPPLTSISQPPSTRVSPVARDLAYSPTRGSYTTRRYPPGTGGPGIGGRSTALGHNYISRSYNSTPLPGQQILNNNYDTAITLGGVGGGYQTDPNLYPTSSAYPPSYNATTTDPGVLGTTGVGTLAGGNPGLGGNPGFPYYDDPGSPIMDGRMTGTGVYQGGGPVIGPTGIVHGGPRARSARIPRGYGYSTLDRQAGYMGDPMMDARMAGAGGMMGGGVMSDPYLRSTLDRQAAYDAAYGGGIRRRDRSLDRSVYLRDEHGYRADGLIDDPYARGLSHSVPAGDPRHTYGRDSFIMELQARLNELQNQYGHVKRELDATTQKLGSSMHSIKTFWSPELKKERALRKEEAAKYALLTDQLKILRAENQVSLEHFV